MAIFFLIVLWVIWCTLHSMLISPGVTAAMKNRLDDNYKYYRLFYNILALLTLIPLVVYSNSLTSNVVLRWQGAAVVLQVVLFLSAVFFFAAGAMKYDAGQFLGTAQIKSGNSHSILTEGGALDTGGILSVTRHPWYLGGLLILWSYKPEIYLHNLLVNSVLTVYLIIGTLLEERKLKARFGDEYRRYIKDVSMLFPLKWLVQFCREPRTKKCCR